MLNPTRKPSLSPKLNMLFKILQQEDVCRYFDDGKGQLPLSNTNVYLRRRFARPNHLTRPRQNPEHTVAAAH